MTGDQPLERDVPLSHLPPGQKAVRAASFGGVASHYERYRPGPPDTAVDWVLPEPVRRIVDLGAGTGALSRLLVGRADEVVAVEPDDRMRAVLEAEVPGVRAVDGRGESMPLPDRCADAVVASSSWHWMDTVPALHEVGRVLVPGGTLAAMWSGPDPEGAFLVQARALLSGSARDGDAVGPTAGDGGADAARGAGPSGALAELVMGDADRPPSSLEIPADAGAPFGQPDHEVFTWDVALTADDLIGMLGTFSWIITMPEESRAAVLTEARRLLRELLGIEGAVTVDVAFRADCWRARRHG